MTTDNQGLPQDQRDSEALKPCPFCGSDAEHIHVYAGEEIVRCVSIDDCGVGFSGDNEEELRNVWNTRAILGAEDIRSGGFKDAIDAIRGAIAFGQQGANTAPSDHWLAEFWSIGQRLAAQSADASNAATGKGLRRDQEAAYDSIDRFLRNNLCDEDYAQYSADLDRLLEK